RRAARHLGELPKAQIKSIHITRDGFAAENHNAGASFYQFHNSVDTLGVGAYDELERAYNTSDTAACSRHRSSAGRQWCSTRAASLRVPRAGRTTAGRRRRDSPLNAAENVRLEPKARSSGAMCRIAASDARRPQWPQVRLKPDTTYRFPSGRKEDRLQIRSCQ